MLLKVIQPAREQPRFLETAQHLSFGNGFHAEETEGGRPFRWMSDHASLTFEADAERRFLELWVLSEFRDLIQGLQVGPETTTESCRLPHGWSPLSLELPAGATSTELKASPTFPVALHPLDQRVLTVRVRDVRLHKDEVRHSVVRAQYVNGLRNAEEILHRRTRLESTPPSLGIDLHGVCNVKPPCVYCEWDHNKALEGDNVDVPFTLDTLKQWGPFFDNSVHLVNCSIGEPFMMRNFDDLLDTFGTTGKVLEMSTNGQILTDRNIQRLVGRSIDLYISLDAATPLTYSRLRNDTFEKIIHNIERLVAAKGGRGRYPQVNLVFMPMRCNVHELDQFVSLCSRLNVDRMVLRPLNFSPASELNAERAGYEFRYQHELLPFDELVRASARAAILARESGVDLSDQMNFGGELRADFSSEFAQEEATTTPTHVDASPTGESADDSGRPTEVAEAAVPPSLGGESEPACLEPWKSLYILRRGVMPCCYGGAPIAPMDQYRESWNSPLMQGIRGELLSGRFHDYCLRSPACPIVRKAEHASRLPMRQQVLLKTREYVARANRRLGGVPIRTWSTVRWFGAVALRRVRRTMTR